MKRKPFYAESTLNRLYKEIGFRTVDIISEYVTAFSNLYGIIETDEAWKIIEQYFEIEDEPPFTKEEFEAYLHVAARDERNDFFVDPLGYYYDHAPDITVIVNKNITIRMDEDTDEETIGKIADSIAEDKDYDGPGFLTEDISLFWKVYESRGGKDYYVPEFVWEFLKYSIDDYYEENAATEAMMTYLKKDCRLAENKARVILDNMVYYANNTEIQFTDVFQLIIEDLEMFGVRMTRDKVSQLSGLLTDVSNHTRLWVNKGHTPLELAGSMPRGQMPKIEFGPGIREQIKNGTLDANEMRKSVFGNTDLPLKVRGNLLSEIEKALKPGEEKWINGTVVKGEKIGPNDPCPCGSGKKYKKCCGKN